MQEPIQQPQFADKALTYEEFLAFVADKDEEYEFVNGRAIALASPSAEHARLVTVLTYLVYGQLRGSRCDVYGSMDLETVPGKKPRRPDILITCDKRDSNHGPGHEHAIHFPKLIIEVLSPNRGDDLGDKLNEYQALPSLEEYLIIDSSRHWVRRYYRSVEHKLIFDADQIGGTVQFASIGYLLDIDALYIEAGV